jgi:putative ABC transport system permease protein
MTGRHLVVLGLLHYWRTNTAVVAGVATAVAVLAGALLVGDSVRGSLRDLVLQRIGRTDRVVMSSGFFREALADEVAADGAVGGATPMIGVEAVVSNQASGRRASRVQVYGVDNRFWRFHGVAGIHGPEGRAAMISRALATDLAATTNSVVLVRLQRPSAIPIESLHGRKDDAGRTIRLDVGGVLDAAQLGDFSLRPQQGEVRAIFVPLTRLQQDLDLAGRVNTLLVAERSPGTANLETIIRQRFALEDVGVTLREVGGAIAVESAAGFLDAPRVAAIEAAARAAGLRTQPVLTYLANSMRSGNRQVPYSLVTATDLDTIVERGPAAFAPTGLRRASPKLDDVSAERRREIAGRETAAPPQLAEAPEARRRPIVLNEWAARDLGVKVGDPLALDYYLWEDPGRLVTRTADFHIAAIVPIAGAAADRDFAPVYPGITGAASLGDWDPPFPIDLKQVRPVDEDYWHTYRTTPKAFVPFEVGQSLWQSRYGDRTSVRVLPAAGEPLAVARARLAARLREAIDPMALGVLVRDVRGEGLAASRGATDFGAYFTYFSFFLVASALLLAVLFFRLAVEQRAREVGLLRAVGFSTPRVRRLFLVEGLVLASIGSAIGAAGAVAYAGAMMLALRTWWVGAVSTRSLTLHVSAASLAAGVAGVLAAAILCIWWTLRALSNMSERSLLAGQGIAPRGGTRPFRAASKGAVAFALLGVGLMAASAAGAVDRTAAFFGAGSSLLIACLCVTAAVLRRPPRSVLGGSGWPAMSRLGLRNASDRPGRSVLAIGVIASATFILISVDAFRKEAPSSTDRSSGVGGYPLLVNLLLPMANDPNTREGREAIGLGALPLGDLTVEPFRVRPGDDASCLNLYEPASPRIFGVRSSFAAAGRFAFQSSLAATDVERANPWLLLNRTIPSADGEIVPVIADANSMTYVLHKSLGDDLVLVSGATTVRLRLVAALADSIFQGELLMSDANFVRLFPAQAGYQFLLVDTSEQRAAAVAAAIEQGAGDLGADAMSTVERLGEFHAVENTYLQTFKTLGGLGLLVGTVGLAAVLLRNVLERRRELALLGATGYRRGHIFAMIVAENALLLGAGLAAGAVCAAIAIAPAAVERGGHLPAAASGGMLVAAVFVAGLLSSIVATSAALRSPLLDALRAE